MLREKEMEKFQYLLEIRDHISRLPDRVQGKKSFSANSPKKQLYILFIPDTPTATPFMVVRGGIVFLVPPTLDVTYLTISNLYLFF